MSAEEVTLGRGVILHRTRDGAFYGLWEECPEGINLAMARGEKCSLEHVDAIFVGYRPASKKRRRMTYRTRPHKPIGR